VLRRHLKDDGPWFTDIQKQKIIAEYLISGRPLFSVAAKMERSNNSINFLSKVKLFPAIS